METAIPKAHIMNNEYADLSLERAIFRDAGFELVEASGSDEELLEQVRDTHGLLCIFANIDSKFASQLTQCKGISRPGTGYDTIDVKACREHGIEVSHLPDYGDGEVATHAAAMMLAMHQKVIQHAGNTAENIWDFKLVTPPKRLKNCTLAVIGYGRIGKDFVERMLPFVKDVLVLDPMAKDGTLPENVRLASLDEICEEADLISLHCPSIPQTYHMLNAEVFAKMKRAPLLVNASRGALIDVEALIGALDEGLIGAAALDVLEKEPEIHPGLLGRKNVILTPHVGWLSSDNQLEIRTRAAKELVKMMLGEKPTNPAP